MNKYILIFEIFDKIKTIKSYQQMSKWYHYDIEQCQNDTKSLDKHGIEFALNTNEEEDIYV